MVWYLGLKHWYFSLRSPTNFLDLLPPLFRIYHRSYAVYHISNEKVTGQCNRDSHNTLDMLFHFTWCWWYSFLFQQLRFKIEDDIVWLLLCSGNCGFSKIQNTNSRKGCLISSQIHFDCVFIENWRKQRFKGIMSSTNFQFAFNQNFEQVVGINEKREFNLLEILKVIQSRRLYQQQNNEASGW